ncbi:ATP-dependent Clp protease adapter ClpS [Neisseriaceae bacterium B1]
MALQIPDSLMNLQKTTPPKRYGVFLLNDHYTPMDFVVMVLQEVFMLPENQAVNTMLAVHHEGKGLCGSYTRDIAQTKQQQVMSLATEAGHPLMCTVEELP